mgnify:CR=1 FL=1
MFPAVHYCADYDADLIAGEIRKAGYKTIASQVYDPEDPHLDTDSQFGVTKALIGNFVEDGEGYTLEFGFVIEPGEVPWDAAVREAAEETGLPVALAGEQLLHVRRRLRQRHAVPLRHVDRDDADGAATRAFFAGERGDERGRCKAAQRGVVL